MRHVAFLRGMNVGGHRLTNEELCAHLAALGLRDVWAFQASGNVVFDAGRRGDVARHVETGLRAALGYEVPTFLRSEDEVVEVASRVTFDPDARAGRGKEQVLFLAEVPSPADARAVLALATDEDRLALHGRELHWLPRGSVLDTGLDLKCVERALGPTTVRTRNTVERLARKLRGA